MNSLDSRLRPETLTAFLVLTLLALLLLPFWTQYSVRELREEIDNSAEPARTTVAEVQYLLARQTSSLRGHVITSDSVYLEQFAQFAAEEQALYRELERLIPTLGPAIQQEFGELKTLSREWHQRLEREGGQLMAVLPGELPFEQMLYHEALASAGRLDEALAQATAIRRQEITDAEIRGAKLSAVLALLAVTAVIIVAHLGARIRRLAREAAVAADERTRAQEARSRLLRGVSHDVKNPLGAADGYAELLEMELKGPLLPEQLAFVAKIRHSIHSAIEVIHNLLEVSRAESQFVRVERELIDCSHLVRDVVENYGGAAQRAGLSLSCTPEPCSPVYTDPELVRRVIGNLLSNAIKYTPPPGVVEVRAGARQADDSEVGSMVVIEVSDTGPGVAPEQAEAIFDEFVRLHSDTVPGHGLGLAISRRYARLLGGDLTVHRGPAGGAIFSLHLPLRAADLQLTPI